MSLSKSNWPFELPSWETGNAFPCIPPCIWNRDKWEKCPCLVGINGDLTESENQDKEMSSHVGNTVTLCMWMCPDRISNCQLMFGLSMRKLSRRKPVCCRTTYHWQPGFHLLKPQICWKQAWDEPPTGRGLKEQKVKREFRKTDIKTN